MLNGSNWQNAWLNEISKSPFDRTQFSHQKEIYKAGEAWNPVIKTPFNLMIKTPVRATASRIRAANSVAVSSTLIMEHLSFIFFSLYWLKMLAQIIEFLTPIWDTHMDCLSDSWLLPGPPSGHQSCLRSEFIDESNLPST